MDFASMLNSYVRQSHLNWLHWNLHNFPDKGVCLGDGRSTHLLGAEESHGGGELLIHDHHPGVAQAGEKHLLHLQPRLNVTKLHLKRISDNFTTFQ